MLEKIYAELEGSKDVLKVLVLEIIKKNKEKNRVKERNDGIVISMKYIPSEIEKTLTKTGYLIRKLIPGTNLEMYTDMKYLYIYPIL